MSSKKRFARRVPMTRPTLPQTTGAHFLPAAHAKPATSSLSSCTSRVKRQMVPLCDDVSTRKITTEANRGERDWHKKKGTVVEVSRGLRRQAPMRLSGEQKLMDSTKNLATLSKVKQHLSRFCRTRIFYCVRQFGWLLFIF